MNNLESIWNAAQDWVVYLGLGLGIALCAGRFVYLKFKPREPEGCWLKPDGYLRDDNYHPPTRKK